MNKNNAFTLVEVLVVVAIIALLLAILLPALGKAKETATDVACRANLKQWGIVWQVYANEHKGLMPDATGFGALRGDWIVALREDYPTGKMTLCPMATKWVDYNDPNKDHGGVFSTYRNSTADGYEYCSYGMNNWAYSTVHWAMNYGVAKGDKKIWRTLQVDEESSNIPLFMDSAYRGSFPEYDGYDWIYMPSEELPDNGFDRVYAGIRQFAMPRHRPQADTAGTNVVFFDMSARHVPVKEMWTLKWHRLFDTTEYQNRRSTIWPGTWMDRFVDP